MLSARSAGLRLSRVLASRTYLGRAPARPLSSSADPSSIGAGLENVSVDFDEARGVAVVELTRHAQMNALTRSMATNLADVIEALDGAEGVRAVVLTGGARAFAAGAELGDDEDALEASEGEVGEDAARHGPGTSWMARIDGVGVPLVAAVDGFALGPGCGLALAADVVIAGQGAMFGVPEVRLGRVPAWGVGRRLARVVGRAKAMEMVLTGRQMDAAEAESSGLVARVAPKGESLREAVDVAREIAGLSAPVVRAARRCVVGSAAVEREAVREVRSLKDYEEGVKAFLAKRDPHWKHR